MFNKRRRVGAEGMSRKKERFTCSCLTRPRPKRQGVCAFRLPALAVLVVLAACMSGCIAAGRKSDAAARRPKGNASNKSDSVTNTLGATSHPSEKMLAAIRQELVVGDYAKAHQDLEMVGQQDHQLTRAEQREVKDNLCLTEYLIGQASYPLSEQQRTCSGALAEAGSVSGAVLARIHDSLKQISVERVRRAIEAQDLAEAEAVALAYRAAPGGDSELLAEWSKEFWEVVHGQERPGDREARVIPLIAKLADEYPQAKVMSEPDFRHWVIEATAVSNKPIILGFNTKGDTLDLLVPEQDLVAIASNLYEFVRINDVFAARCGCDARTNVGITESGFPAYLFRLDPEERTSKVLIAMRPSAAGATLPLPGVPGELLATAIEAKAPTAQSATELSQEVRTSGKPGQGSTSDVISASSKGAVQVSPASAPLKQQLSRGEQAKPEPKPSRSNLQPYRPQPTRRPISKVELRFGCVNEIA
jgi:hypothetical protein